VQRDISGFVWRLARVRLAREQWRGQGPRRGGIESEELEYPADLVPMIFVERLVLDCQRDDATRSEVCKPGVLLGLDVPLQTPDLLEPG
jgi:hypothetical protein